MTREQTREIQKESAIFDQGHKLFLKLGLDMREEGADDFKQQLK